MNDNNLKELRHIDINSPELYAYDIFDVEEYYKRDNGDKQPYIDFEREHLSAMSDYIILHIIKKPNSPHFASFEDEDRSYYDNQLKHLSAQLKLSRKEPVFPFQNYFFHKHKLYEYSCGIDLIVKHEDRKEFRIFFMFKLRHIGIDYCNDFLDYQASIYPDDFFDFLDTILIQNKHGKVIPEIRVEHLTNWIEKRKKKLSETHTNEINKVDKKEFKNLDINSQHLAGYYIFKAESYYKRDSGDEKPYVDFERKYITEIADYLEMYIINNPNSKYFLSLETNNERYKIKYDKIFVKEELSKEKPRFPLTRYFMYQDKLYEYSNGVDCIVKYEDDREIFRIFFMFKLRHIGIDYLNDFLDYQSSIYPDDFFVFLELIFTENNDNKLITDKRIKHVENWINRQVMLREDKSDNIKSNLTQYKKSEPPKPKISKKSLEENINTALEYIKFMGGVNHSGEQIMSMEDFERLQSYLTILIKDEKLPAEITPFSTLNISNGFIQYTFYLIHKELYGIKPKRKYFIDFLKSVFSQFGNTEFSTLETKFSVKPSNYDDDVRKMQR